MLTASMSAATAADDVNALIETMRFREAEPLIKQHLAAVAKDSTSPAAAFDAYTEAFQLAWRRGQWAEARKHLDSVADLLKKQPLPVDDVRWLQWYRLLMEFHADAGELKQSDDAFNRAVQHAEKHDLARAPAYERMLAERAEVLEQQERWWEAVELRQQQLQWLNQHAPKEGFRRGQVWLALGRLHYNFGRSEASYDAFAQAKPLLEALYREQSPRKRETIDALRRWVFEALNVGDVGDWDRCALWRELIQVTEQELGAASPALIEPLTEHAIYCHEEMGSGKARAAYERALRIATDSLGELHPKRLYVWGHFGVFHASNEYSELTQRKGEDMLNELAALEKKAYTEVAPVLAVSRLRWLAQEVPQLCWTFETGKCRKLIDHYLTTLRKAWGKTHPALASLQTRVATRLGDGHSESEEGTRLRALYTYELCDDALQSAKQSLGENHPDAAGIAIECGKLRGYQGQYVDAQAAMSYAAGVLTQHFGAADDMVKETAFEAERLAEVAKHRQ
jgi:hypothetical protein